MASTREIAVTNNVGLHARPAATFVQTAAGFKSRIMVENLSRATQAVNAKSLLSLLSIGVRKDDHIRITGEGEDEQAALQALCRLIEENFGEG